MDLVLMPFGMDYPIVIGKINKKGSFNVNISLGDIENVPVESREMFTGDLYFNLHFSCDNSDEFGIGNDEPAVRIDYIRMFIKDQWTGTAFLVSDENLLPWLEDKYYKNAILGSFYEVVYVGQDMVVNTTCTSEKYVSDELTVKAVYDYDLNLVKGFNWIEYVIEEVYITGSEELADFPLKVKVQSPSDPSKIRWIGKYY
ncbi:MAG: hypothetical protein RIC06_06460 [Cyclobacteriaceae bacterium]